MLIHHRTSRGITPSRWPSTTLSGLTLHIIIRHFKTVKKPHGAHNNWFCFVTRTITKHISNVIYVIRPTKYEILDCIHGIVAVRIDFLATFVKCTFSCYFAIHNSAMDGTAISEINPVLAFPHKIYKLCGIVHLLQLMKQRTYQKSLIKAESNVILH